MFSQLRKLGFSHHVLAQLRCQSLPSVCLRSTSATEGAENYLTFGSADPGPQFMNPDTQKLLKSLTRLDVGRIFRKRSVKEATLRYKFMTTDQIQEEVETALQGAEAKLQMPPVMKVKIEDVQMLSMDPALRNFDDSDYVFTDITYGIPDTDRTIVIRRMDGSLSTASLEVRKRLNQAYFPLHGRQIRTPKLFEDDKLKSLLALNEFEFILDAMCIQFEPYEKKYHEISALVYQHINDHNEFDKLRSTRHFGPMVFYLAWHNQIDNLLLDLIKRDYLDNGVDLVELTCKLSKRVLSNAEQFAVYRTLIDKLAANGNKLPSVVDEEVDGMKSVGQLEADRVAMQIIKQYVQEHGVKKVQLELAIQTYVERAESQRKLLRGIQVAHGASE